MRGVEAFKAVGVAASAALGGAKDSRQAKLRDAAQQFEAMLLGEMLKPMQAQPEDGETGALSGGDTLASFGREAVARAIAKGGGFGIARQIERQVAAQHPAGTLSVASGTKVPLEAADAANRGK